MICAGCTERAESEKKNVFYISTDNLRPQVRPYGHEFARTPGIDEVAANGVTFTRAYANVPVCGASRASVMTGLRLHHCTSMCSSSCRIGINTRRILSIQDSMQVQSGGALLTDSMKSTGKASE